MNLDKLTARYIPYTALVAYKLENDHSEEGLESQYLESYDLINKPGTNQFQLGSGRPLDEHTLDELAEFLKKRKSKKEKVFTFKSNLIPQKFLYAGIRNQKRAICWTMNKPTKYLYFSSSLNIAEGKVKLPNLVFILKGQSLKVYAFKTKALTEKSTLYKGPFHNTTEAGICMGSAKITVKSHYWEDLAFSAENAFFNSKFTHLNGNNPVNGNLNLIYDKCISNQIPFPLDSLIPIKKGLTQLL